MKRILIKATPHKNSVKFYLTELQSKPQCAFRQEEIVTQLQAKPLVPETQAFNRYCYEKKVSELPRKR